MTNHEQHLLFNKAINLPLRRMKELYKLINIDRKTEII